MNLLSEKYNQNSMIPDKDKLLRLRQQYKKGVRTVFCRWDNGSGLGLPMV